MGQTRCRAGRTQIAQITVGAKLARDRDLKGGIEASRHRYLHDCGATGMLDQAEYISISSVTASYGSA
ncbi:hypothetical protein EMIT0P176_60251 [Pseudomonas sp. IT-P176]